MPGTVSWEALAFVVTVIMGAGGLVAGLTWRMMAAVARIQREHDEFRIKVAETYATLAALDKVQAAVAEEMRGLRGDFAGGFDRVVEVMRTIVQPLAQPPAPPARRK